MTGALAGAPMRNERPALPGSDHRVVWVTGDAKLERIATVDWAANMFSLRAANGFARNSFGFETLRRLEAERSALQGAGADAVAGLLSGAPRLHAHLLPTLPNH